MSSSLFRQQAVEAKANDVLGNAQVISPLHYKVIAVLAITAAVAFLGIVFLGHYAKKLTTVGYVTTTEADVRVFSSAGGVISEIYVSDGELVKRGQPLLMISTASMTSVAATESMQAELLTSIRAESESLRGKIARAAEASRFAENTIRLNIDNALFQIDAIEDQIVDARKGLRIAEKKAERLLELRTRFLVSDDDVEAAQASFLEKKLNLSSARRELTSQRAMLEQFKIERLQLPVERADKIADLETLLRLTEQRISETEGLRAKVVVAPVAGKVSDLGSRLGQRVSAETPLFALLPETLDYYAEVYVPSRSIAFVGEGSEIRLRFDAYPYQKYGIFSGTVMQLATTPIRPGEPDAPIQILEPSYRMSVALEDQPVSSRGEALNLQAGMTLRADIVRDERRIIDWLFEPFVGAVQRVQ